MKTVCSAIMLVMLCECIPRGMAFARAAETLEFQLMDVRTAKPVRHAAVFLREDQKFWAGDPDTQPPWSLYRVLERGSLVFREHKPLTLPGADVLVLAMGYQPFKFKLNEEQELEPMLVKRLELTPMPSVEFTIVTRDGQPVADARFETIPPHETLGSDEFDDLFRFRERLKRLLDIDATSDEQGQVRIQYPAFGKSIVYRLRHSAGYADVNVRDLPPASPSDGMIRQRVELRRYATVRGKYLPQIGPNEHLELCPLLPNRLTCDGPEIRVRVNERGGFEIGQLRAGWHCFVHRIHYGGADGHANSTALVCFETFQVADGQVVELTLGENGCPVRGRLMIPAGYQNEKHLFELAIQPDVEFPRYPTAPGTITDEQGVIAWWDAYWDSDGGRQFREYNFREVHTAVAKDGSFSLPVMQPGTYRISRVLTTGNLDSPLKLPETSFTIPDDGNRDQLDLGDILVRERK